VEKFTRPSTLAGAYTHTAVVVVISLLATLDDRPVPEKGQRRSAFLGQDPARFARLRGPGMRFTGHVDPARGRVSVGECVCVRAHGENRLDIFPAEKIRPLAGA
jgi:hypothetical protein